LRLAGRALVYGLACMRIDGHLPQWGVADDQYARAVEVVPDFFIAGVSRGAAEQALEGAPRIRRPKESPAPPRHRPRSGP
jgi:hypothetical protein